MKKLVFIIFLFPFFTCLSQEANEILKKSEEKIRGIKSSYQEMSIKIVRPKWSKEMKMKGWSIGEDYFASVVLSPAKEKGIVFLKRENEVWNYIPSIERTVKLPPSMMMQNWMGTDFTNDDLVQRSSIINDYSNTIIKEEEIEGLDCWVIELNPNEDAAVVWGKLMIWIDKKDYMQLKTQFFDEYDELVSIMHGKSIKTFDGKKLPSIIEFIPLDKKGNKTIVERIVWKFDIDINSRFFMPNNMKNLR
ncbi:MAG: outer membrane lipoprotein-sorting protein [Pelagibacterales bacterium]|jgi:outer membrane lipoprotein-sorting protein|nr:outer membrane lipoprotein-sorting protein [Pelagibacterales bacterium]MBT6447190.1 outer membrane lipoprotein-sorting protein [Flavobacteriaceae bacterium]MBT7624064.1 outer membrane lipoprotein-sorting protein [Flavobacteriaceae bacterium]MDG1831424.1 outer membrane lipoprotein-sorting protein [Flavobacteriaceae bacterium]